MTDRWRYRCPRGHTTWEARTQSHGPTLGKYYCRSCCRTHGDGPFDELVDVKDPAPRHIVDPEVTAV